ncbi:MAG: hypothetical protein Tsb0026_08450 [Sulfuricaulis sp.]
MRDASQPTRRVMAVLGVVAPMLFFAALILTSLLRQSTPALAHMILAAGVMPLIMAAMIYFTPVLTHSRASSWPVLLLPGVALLAGVWAVASIFWWRDLIIAPALGAMFTAGALLGWIWQRARTTLGRPHPGLSWYLLALVSLILGLSAISVAAFWPEHWAALRRFHLHINIYGFIGLTAVGTLRVLLPTVAGYIDVAARERLQCDVYPMAFGVLLMAAGSAWWTWLVWPGLVLWLIPLMRFTVPLVSRWREHVWGWHRPAASLGLAVMGLMLVLIAGGLHAVGVLPASVVLTMFFHMFLFPLVTGAISYLLPVWVWPTRNTGAYNAAVRRLARGSGARALVFFMAGVAAWAGLPGAVYLAGAVMAVFLVQAIWALSARFSMLV